MLIKHSAIFFITTTRRDPRSKCGHLYKNLARGLGSYPIHSSRVLPWVGVHPGKFTGTMQVKVHSSVNWLFPPFCRNALRTDDWSSEKAMNCKWDSFCPLKDAMVGQFFQFILDSMSVSWSWYRVVVVWLCNPYFRRLGRCPERKDRLLASESL